MAVYAAVGHFTCNRYQIMATVHGNGYKLIVDEYWKKNVFPCGSVIAAKAMIEQIERKEEKSYDEYDWEADETAFYWASQF